MGNSNWLHTLRSSTINMEGWLMYVPSWEGKKYLLYIDHWMNSVGAHIAKIATKILATWRAWSNCSHKVYINFGERFCVSVRLSWKHAPEGVHQKATWSASLTTTTDPPQTRDEYTTRCLPTVFSFCCNCTVTSAQIMKRRRQTSWVALLTHHFVALLTVFCQINSPA